MAGVHAKKGPSGAERLHACPGALPVIGLIPEEERMGSGPAASLGTCAHFLLEKCLAEKKHPKEFEDRIIELIGETEDGSMLRPGAKQPTGDRVWYRVDEDMIYGVGLAVDYVEKRLVELDVPRTDLLLESKTNPCPERDDTWGTADVSIDVWPILLEVVDYKNGYGLVEHRDNPQLLAYLAGRAHDTGWSHSRYMITVVQPNAHHEEGRVRTFEVSKADLQAFVEKHRAAAILSDEAADDLDLLGNDINAKLGRASNDPTEGATWADAWLNAGEHCDGTMCEGRLSCPAYRVWKQRKAAIDFDDEPPEVPKPKTASLQDDTVVAILKWAPYLEATIRLARAYVAKRRKDGVIPAGMKVVRSKPRGRIWKDNTNPHALAKALVKAGYISDNEQARLFTEPSLITGPAAEKLVPSKLRKAFSNEFLTMPQGALTVVPEDDPRDAVTFNPADDFPDEVEGGD
jgi:hypothetical protein